MSCRPVPFFALLVLLASTALASERWLRVDGSGIEIWTNAGEEIANQSLHTLQQIRHILLAIAPGGERASRTLRLVIFRTDTEFARFRPSGESQAAGFFLPGRQYDYIVTENVVAPGLRRIILHESLHSYLHGTTLPLPHWFDEGMAELFSNLETTRSEVRVGLPIAAHIQGLLAETDIDLTTLFTPAAGRLFYAKSWALVRLLTLDDAYRPHVGQFLYLVATGSPHGTAFQEAFGKSVAGVAADLRRSLTARQLAPWVLNSNWPDDREPAQPVRQPVGAAELVVADLLQNLQRYDEARNILTGLAATNEDGPEIEAQLGDIFSRQGHPEKALQHYSKAIQLGSTEARIYFLRAMLRREDQAARPQVIEDLRRAVDLNPGYAEAYGQLNALSLSEQPVLPRNTAQGGWTNHRGDQRVDGSLVEVDCVATPARLVFNTPQGALALQISDPAQVMIGNDPGISSELKCGTMQPRAVAVEYLTASKEITAIQFK